MTTIPPTMAGILKACEQAPVKLFDTENERALVQRLPPADTVSVVFDDLNDWYALLSHAAQKRGPEFMQAIMQYAPQAKARSDSAMLPPPERCLLWQSALQRNTWALPYAIKTFDPLHKKMNTPDAMGHRLLNDFLRSVIQDCSDKKPQNSGNEATIDILLDIAKCNPNFASRDGTTPLMLAIETQNPYLIEALLRRGGSVMAVITVGGKGPHADGNVVPRRRAKTRGRHARRDKKRGKNACAFAASGKRSPIRAKKLHRAGN